MFASCKLSQYRINSINQGLEAELRGRDLATISTNKAVNKLEVHHVTMLQDMRGRIIRCDTSIAKHSKDLVLLMDEIRRLEAMIYGLREKLLGDIHRLEAEVLTDLQITKHLYLFIKHFYL